MSTVQRCDNCGKETVGNPYRYAHEAREAAFEANAEFVTITVEHNEDVLHFDACSWACCADLALKRAAEAVAQ